MALRMVATAFVLLLLIIVMNGCTTEQLRDPMTNEHQQKLLSVDEKISALESRVSILENKQLTTMDLLDLVGTNSFMPNENTTSVTQGCPSAHDVDIKWFESLNEGDITEAQYQKIVDKYNSEECQ